MKYGKNDARVVPKSNPNGSKWHPREPPVGSRCPKRPHDGSKRLQHGHKEDPRAPKMAPRAFKMAPGDPKMASKGSNLKRSQ